MAVPAASAPARAAHRLAWTASTVRPSTAITPHLSSHRHHEPHLHLRAPAPATTATAAFAQARWAERRTRTPLRPFSTTPLRPKDHHFDTLKFVARLQSEGFTERKPHAHHVLREDQEKATYAQKVDFAKLRSELLSADSTESSLTRASHERLTNDLAKLNSRLRDEVQRTQASVRLDLNLEKGRIREEANSQDLKIKETETRIEQESAALRERLEAVKFSTLQWLMGVCTGTAAIILGVWRLLM
ncbi:Protein FMP32, mitochondrial [Teratosphaeria destructans]|uniref:Protein FMP32, mitochondrial n=1 Tax=Teratosphaeria destructans TaxID=418781 RepID=A0A9W7W0L3_9PEZI|nr:Protein FMP32, mitochondrial [Teratosphaeria destructans]